MATVQTGQNRRREIAYTEGYYVTASAGFDGENLYL
jgi:hypothetical protein